MKEINALSKSALITVEPLKSGEGSRSRWLALDIHTRKLNGIKLETKPKTLADLDRQQKQGALTR